MFKLKNINSLRKELNKNQKDFAKMFNISESTYAMWESNNDIIPIKRLINICEKLNISLDYALDITTSKTEVKQKFNLEMQGERLKKFRKENHITQKELEKIMNYGSGVISGYEKNRYIAPTLFLYTICNKYRISADYLLGRIDEPVYIKQN